MRKTTVLLMERLLFYGEDKLKGDEFRLSGDKPLLSGDNGWLSGDKPCLRGDNSRLSGDKPCLTGDNHFPPQFFPLPVSNKAPWVC